MIITRDQIRVLIKEVLLHEQVADDTGTGNKAVQAFIVDELLAQDEELTREDVIQQAEGAGFDSKEVEEVLDMLLDTEVIKEEEEIIVVV
jgi:hypothetical protein